MIRIFFKSDKSSNVSISYMDVQCESWNASPTLLTVYKEDGSIRHFPLMNIECFLEMSDES